MKRNLVIVVSILTVLTVGLIAAENEQKRERPQQRQGQQDGQRQRGEGMDMSQMRQMMQERMLNAVKEKLNVSAEEWTVIEPRITEVMKLQQESMINRVGGMMGGRDRRGPGSENGNSRTQNTSDMSKSQIASNALQDVLNKENPTVDEINAKLTALRAAKTAEKQALLVAQQKLKEVLTVQQEAQLVVMGTLD